MIYAGILILVILIIIFVIVVLKILKKTEEEGNFQSYKSPRQPQSSIRSEMKTIIYDINDPEINKTIIMEGNPEVDIQNELSFHNQK